MKFEIITREEAHALKRKRFYTGRPCRYGHDAQRFVSTGGCTACNVVRSRIFSQISAANGKTFSYVLHPDDVAAALAYCQALDLQRGRTPFVPKVPAVPTGAEPLALPADIARHRATLAESFAPSAPSYLPKP